MLTTVKKVNMKICFVDEAGCTGRLLTATSQIQPIFAIGGVIFDARQIPYATAELLHIKGRYFPGKTTGLHLDGILSEIKGSDIRKSACSKNRNKRRHTFGFVDRICDLVTKADAKLVGRLWVKEIGGAMNSRSIYTASVQRICEYFHRYLVDTDDEGFIVCDARLKHLNSQVAHSVFTQKFKATGDKFPRIIDLPTFGHSDNHACLQISDLILSALIFPIAAETYCVGNVTNTHIRPGYSRVKARYAGALKNMQYRFTDAAGRYTGGLVIADGIGKKPGSLMFK
ncbi:MAG: DUF3800 domain-containing protein [Nitratireductor sp.]